MRLALFDFDGTITKNDSFLMFIRFAFGDTYFMLGIIALAPHLLAYKLKLIPNYVAKQKMISFFFKGMKKDKFNSLATIYSKNHIDKIVKKTALNRLNWHKKKGHKVVIVSASIENWLRPWCKKNKIDLLATKIEVKNDILTGNLSSKNCFASEKVTRIKKKYNLCQYELIYGYGDSKGDNEMLALANKKYYKFFS